MRSKQIDVVLGLQRGDEGKGRISDKLAASHDIVARYNGGPNAGHTIYANGQAIALHQVPAGVLYPKVLNIVGHGMYIDPIKLVEEINDLQASGVKISPQNLAISYGAHLILPHHILQDEQREGGASAQGSTKVGIAYVAADKYERSGVRAELLVINPKLLQQKIIDGLQKVRVTPNPAKVKKWLKTALQLKNYVTDTAQLLNDQLSKDKSVLAEGAQAAWLDIDGGMYPYVTSSHPTIGGVLNGLRVGHQYIGRVIGVMKAIPSHVGDGPFVTEIAQTKLADQARGQRASVDGEFGATTGRPRRVGWLDLPMIHTATRDNGVSELALTKLDSLQKFTGLRKISIAVAYKYGDKLIREAPASAYMLEACQPIYKELPLWPEDISQARSWDELPSEAKKFVQFLEKELDLPITMIGVGPAREQLITRN